MLPVFPKARKALKKAFNDEIADGFGDAAPLLKKIRFRAISEGDQAFIQRDDGVVEKIQMNRHTVERSHKCDYATGLDPVSFMKLARDFGKEMGEKIMRDLLLTIEVASRESGNTIKISEGVLTFDKYLEMLDKIDMEFDESGQPRWPTMVVGPNSPITNALKDFVKDPPKIAAISAVIEEKRKQYYEREANRRMVD